MIPSETNFVEVFEQVQTLAYVNALSKGWWDEPREDGTLLMLMVSELSEALEYLRHNNPPSDHIPDFSGVEEELADVIIRIFDFAQARQLRVAEAIVAKMEFNASRPHKHGGKQF